MPGFGFGFGFGLNRMGGESFLLDTYTGAAAAYSLRQLSTSTTNVVRVRRSSDDSEQDFTASEITDGTLTTFTGAGDGFVTTIYDQAGANNMTRSTAALQGRIVSSGVVETLNGQPYIKRVAADATMESDYAPNGGTKTIFHVGQVGADYTAASLVGSKTGAGDYNHFAQNEITSIILHNSSTVTNAEKNGVTFSPSNRDEVHDGLKTQNLLSYNCVYAFSDNSLVLGYRPGGAGPAGFGCFDFQEFILFDADKSSERVDITTAIADHYSITLA